MGDIIRGRTWASGETMTAGRLNEMLDGAVIAAGALSANAAGRAKMADGFLSADAVGRAKMADGFLSADAVGRAKMANGFLSADAVGRAKMADGFLSADAAGRAKMANGYLSADAAGRAKMADGFVTAAKLECGIVVQVAQAVNAGYSSTVSGMPYTSLPTKVQGTEVLSLAFQAKSATNKVLIVAQIMCCAALWHTAIMSVWRDDTYVAGGVAFIPAESPTLVYGSRVDTPGKTDMVTYTARLGGVSKSMYVNGNSNVAYPSCICSLTAIEFQA